MSGEDSSPEARSPASVGLIEVHRPRHGPAYYVFMVLGILLLVCSLFMNVALLGFLAFRSVGARNLREEVVEGDPEAYHKVAVVSLEGPIVEGLSFLPDYPFSPDMPRHVEEQLREAGSDPRVRAVILEVDSPGGMVATTDSIYQKLLKFKEKHGDKNLVVCMKSLATSGAYYVSMAGDLVVAQPTTVTGSIGVIMHLTNIEGLYQKLGLKAVTIKSGERKDIGSPTRAMSEEERQQLQEIINSMHARFLEVVKKGRENKVDPEALTRISDGSIFTASKAKEIGLIDKVGYLEDAFGAAKELAKISKAQLVRYRRPTTLAELLLRSEARGSRMSQLEAYLQHLSQMTHPTFLYLWVPQTP